MMGAKLNGGSESNLDPGLAAVEKIRGGVKRFYKNQTEAANLLDTGEAPIVGVISDFRAYAMQDAGKPIGFVRPAEGRSRPWSHSISQRIRPTQRSARNS